jgi:hypothetical protein
MRLVLGAKARELYGLLDEVFDSRGAVTAGKSGAAAIQTSFIDVLSSLFKEVALAVEQDEAVIISTFGAAALLDVVVAVQVCVTGVFVGVRVGILLLGGLWWQERGDHVLGGCQPFPASDGRELFRPACFINRRWSA